MKRWELAIAIPLIIVMWIVIEVYLFFWPDPYLTELKTRSKI